MAPGASRFPAVDRPAARAGFVPLTGGAGPPLAFMGFGLASLVVAGVWGAVRAAQGLPVYLHPEVVALAHAWLPGFLLSLCAGACLQLMPVVLGTPLRGPRWLPWAHVTLHVSGSVALVLGLVRGAYGAAAVGGLLVAVGVGLLACATCATFRASPRRDFIAWSFPLSVGWLSATVLAGMVLALNRRSPFLPLPIQALLGAHAHLGLAGFFLTLLQGGAFQLVPMFTLGRASAQPLAQVGLLCTQAGLVALVPGLAFGNTLATTAGAFLIACGAGSSLLAGARTLATRRRRTLETGVMAFACGACLLACVAAGGAAFLAWTPSEGVPPGILLAYGIVVVMGGLALCVLGMLCKILPFLVWMRAFAPFAGRRPVPAATELASKPLERVWLVCHLSGTTGLAAGAATGAGGLAAWGAALLALGALAYGASAARVLLHLVRRPATGPVGSPVPNFS